ncbi:MAG: methylenetetrahydrofolate--tRNA-(uracil(54)-C(5))-methyltransferase (FADH(2)-oxidizing) TrmFO [Erysipelotrichales bacterium]|nr:methylenetetrahydrofolate--tRNA-(uracil(54)-C(5))-methyltransferase (FADH(2)-oxidizing) TrmFO [Erysipelotrichales bacterium]
MKKKVIVVGAGLAGVEATYYLIRHGIEVELYEQRPNKTTGAHHTSFFAELVCSNSLKSNNLDNACGLLKEEMRHMGSLTMEIASKTQVPAGNALSVDRDLFAKQITDKLLESPLVHFHNEEFSSLDEDAYIIVATGPLSSQSIIDKLQEMTNDQMFSFFDACAPIIEKDSIDFNKAYFKSRYEQGDNSYINCAMNEEEYKIFYNELINAELAKLHDFDKKYFEGCMPIEAMAKRGEKTLRYGPLKPMGLRRTPEDRPFAVVQLRQDNVIGSLYNMVGFQTNLTYKEQKRVFSLIPGLENAKFVRYGLMHRNTYICAPKHLNKDLSLKKCNNIFIAGQLSGVEGYVESAATGIIAGMNVLRRINDLEENVPPINTMIGALLNYLSICAPSSFAPMNANYGILKREEKKEKIELSYEALEALDKWLGDIND